MALQLTVVITGTDEMDIAKQLFGLANEYLKAQTASPIHAEPIEHLNLPARTCKLLRRRGIRHIGLLTLYKDTTLQQQVPQLTPRDLRCIINQLASLGLELKPELPAAS